MNEFIIEHFDNHPNAQAWKWVYPDGHTTLVSYRTIVAYCDRDGWIHIYGLYSTTTRKHINWFMKELGFDYQTAKYIFENDLEINRYTKETREIGYN